MRQLELPFAGDIAFDPFAEDQPAHMADRIVLCPAKAIGTGIAITARQRFMIMHGRTETTETAIAPGRPPADKRRLHHQNITPGVRQFQRRIKPRIPAADDRNLRPPGQSRWGRGPRPGAVPPIGSRRCLVCALTGMIGCGHGVPACDTVYCIK